MHYYITEDAVLLIDEIAAVKNQMDRQILKGITEEELALYKKISEQIMSNIREMC
jgi:DNA-binding MarR family transcriptional regulator